MKVKQEIIEAKYSIEDLSKKEFDLFKEGLRALIFDDYRRSPYLSSKGERATELLESLEEGAA